MKVKNLIRISVLSLLLSVMLTVFALADSKIIRFDQTDGCVTPAFTNGATYTAAASAADGYFNLAFKNANIATGNVGRIDFTLDESIDLYTYRFVKIKYRSTFPKIFDIYVNNSGSLRIRNSEVSTDGEWTVAKLVLPNDGSTAQANHGNGFITYTDGSAFPSASKTIELSKFRIIMSGLTADEVSAIKASDDEFYMDIEYIAFFETESEMREYDEDQSVTQATQKIIRFDKANNSIASAFTNGATYTSTTSTADGYFNLTFKNSTISTGNIGRIDFALEESIDLYTCRYIKIKYRSIFPKVFDIYVNNSGSLRIRNSEVSTNDEWTTAELVLPNDGSTAQADHGNGFITYTDGSAFPSASKTIELSKFRIIMTGLTADEVSTIKEADEYVYMDIEYIGFFDSEEAMDAYTDETAFSAEDFGLETLGAQIRANGDINDLRFGFSIDTAKAPVGCAVTEYGAVIGKAGTEPTVNGTGFATVKAVNIYDTNGTVNTFTAVVTDIPDESSAFGDQSATQIVARPYVTYTKGGSRYTVYGESITRSVRNVIDASADGWDK